MNGKAKFYLKSFLMYSAHKVFPEIKRKTAANLISEAKDCPSVFDCVNYYNSGEDEFSVSNKSLTARSFKVRKYPSLPAFDLLLMLQYFRQDLSFDCQLKDFMNNINSPTIVKCRQISPKNNFFVLQKLNTYRFFNLSKDSLSFKKKKNVAIFRGPCHKLNRKEFIKNCFGLPNTDIGDTRKAVEGEEFFRTFTNREEQLKNKFIISIEGNDVASNLPWIMASNSLAFMTKPKFEGWFMQGRLIPDHHYVLLKDDYSDLEEKIDYYTYNTDEALEIVNNAQHHVAQFFDKKRELMISLLVLEKYFRLSGQIE